MHESVFFPPTIFEAALLLILTAHRTLGTPTEATWPGFTTLHAMRACPQWPPQPLEHVVPGLGPDGCNFLQVRNLVLIVCVCVCVCVRASAIHTLTAQGLLRYQPGQRLEAIAALAHPYLQEAAAAQAKPG
jgi:hypothetical protein